jgi:hypothetical protein
VAATEITPTAMGFAKAGELFLLKIKRTCHLNIRR